MAQTEYRPGTLGAQQQIDDADPANLAAFGALLARYDADSRTARQLRATFSHFGIRCALAHTPGSECEICGAIPGFTHHTGCANGRKDLGKITLPAVISENNDAVRAERAARELRESDPLAAARQDRDVAFAAARDEYDRAVERADAVRVRAEENAETCYRAACQRVVNAEEHVTTTVAMFNAMDSAELIRILRMETFALSRTTGRMRVRQAEESAMKVREITRVLERRGVEIPHWRFQDRPVKL